MKMKAFCVLMLLAAPRLWAIDGQVLINQSTVVNTGGFPYRITQPGSYKLSGNLTASLNQPAIVITAPNVFLDLNGFSIQCQLNNNASGVGLRFGCISDAQAPNHDVTIRNGKIATTGTLVASGGLFYLFDIDLEATTRVMLEDAHVETNIPNLPLNVVGSILGGNSIGIGQYSIVRHNIVNAVSNINCPSLIEGNIFTTAAQSAAAGCVYSNNAGPN